MQSLTIVSAPPIEPKLATHHQPGDETTFVETMDKAIKSMQVSSPIVRVRRGDALSALVLQNLKDQGQTPTLKELYEGVNEVALENDIHPDRIFAGQELDLSVLGHVDLIPVPVAEAKEVPILQVEPTLEFIMPTEGRISSHFGPRHHPLLNKLKLHQGVDLAAAMGEAVQAAEEGVVKFAGEQGGYGNMVVLEHPGGYESRYAHLSEIDVLPGQFLSKGSQLGKVGSTGRATGPHLHFELHKDGAAIDPWPLLRG